MPDGRQRRVGDRGMGGVGDLSTTGYLAVAASRRERHAFPMQHEGPPVIDGRTLVHRILLYRGNYDQGAGDWRRTKWPKSDLRPYVREPDKTWTDILRLSAPSCDHKHIHDDTSRNPEMVARATSVAARRSASLG